MIWLGMTPICLIAYSVLTRGYRRIYMLNGMALFMLYMLSLNWYLFRVSNVSPIFRELSAICLLLCVFFFHLSLQFEVHRAMLFPQLSLQFKRDEAAKRKFGLSVQGAKIYSFVQYAAMYYPKSSGARARARLIQQKRSNMIGRGIQSVHVSDSISPFSNHPSNWWSKWYIQRLIEGFMIAKPNYPFTYRSYR